MKIGPGLVREAGTEWEPPAPTCDPAHACCRGGSSFLSVKGEPGGGTEPGGVPLGRRHGGTVLRVPLGAQGIS